MSITPLLLAGSLPSAPKTTAPTLFSPNRRAPLIALCHLSWSGVWQRPQQLLSRLSVDRNVLFVETYCSPVATSEVRHRSVPDQPRVFVLEMHLPAARWPDGDFIDRERRRLLQSFQQQHPQFRSPVLWFNDPMAVTAFAGHLDECAIVYDCMDELSQFLGAPPGIVAREVELLRQADVVFCGGRKMRAKRLPLNSNCHFYGTGVDAKLFGRARDPALPVDPDISKLPGKVLGYFGVVDERIDYPLLAALADALPECSIAMVGPVVKVDPASLPRRPNLHWLGRREYQQLPAITKGFAVCLMPFALNAATEFINPTKALEYMAAGRAVVSTALDEVKTNFDGVCHIANSPAEFIAHCRREARAPDEKRIRRGLALAERNSWEGITSQMSAHVEAAIVARRRATRSQSNPSSPVLQRSLGHV